MSTEDRNDPPAETPEDESARHWAEFADDGGKPPSSEADAESAEESGFDDDDAAPADDAGSESGDDEAGPTDEGDDGTPTPDDGAGGDEAEEVDWSQAPEAIKKAFEAEIAKRDDELRRHRARQAAYDRAIAEQRRSGRRPSQADDESGDGTGEDREAQPDAASDDFDAEMRRAAEEYPEVAAPFLKAFEKLEQQIARLSAAETQREASSFEEHAVKVYEAHPDFDDVLATHRDAFHEWLTEHAPGRLVRAVEANDQAFTDPDGAVEAMKAFKEHAGLAPNPKPSREGGASQPSNARRRRMQAGSEPDLRGARATSSRLPDDASAEDLWNEIKVD